jgi:hypothetical protein
VCPKPIYDEILFETQGCVVTPTLGSIIPNWLLVIPRAPTVNFAKWLHLNQGRPCDLISAVANRYDISEDRVIWFEHGPSETGSKVGCGVDQAHLHILVDAPFSFDEFVSRAVDASTFAWARSGGQEIHPLLDSSRSYLVAGQGSQAFYAQDVDQVGSQFFRRVVAELVEVPGSWDYRIHAHIQNVERTLGRFGRPELLR